MLVGFDYTSFSLAWPLGNGTVRSLVALCRIERRMPHGWQQQRRNGKDKSIKHNPGRSNSEIRDSCRALVAGLTYGAVVFVISIAAQAVIYNMVLGSGGQLRWIGSTVAALCTAILVFRLKRIQEAEDDRARQRLQLVAEVNHHIRNSLQVLVYERTIGHPEGSKAALEAIDRIDWTLKQIAPVLDGSTDQLGMWVPQSKEPSTGGSHLTRPVGSPDYT
jgi:hypothetical protein